MTEAQAHEHIDMPNKPTDDVIGDYVLEKWRKDTRYFFGAWYRYKDGYWHLQHENAMSVELWLLLKKLKQFGVKPSAHKVKNIEAYLQAFLHVADECIDPQNEYINLKNGLYNLKTQELEEHRKDLYFTSQLGFDYSPDAAAPTFLKFLREVLVYPNGKPDGDLEMLVYEALGYSLTSSTDYRTSFWLVGASGSGKSVLLNVLTALAGESHTTIDLDELNNNAYQLADIAGKRVVTFSELRANSVLADNHYKRLVSQDYITARQIFGKPFRFKPLAKIWGAMNEPPRVLDRSDAVFNRIQIIPFHRRVPDDKRDPQLINKLESELSGIFNYAIVGINRLRRAKKFTRPEQSLTALEEYRAENDIELAFFNECCELDPNGEIAAQTLYDTYSNWCSRNGTYKKSSVKVSRDWKRLGLDKHRKTAGHFYTGARLKAEGKIFSGL